MDLTNKILQSVLQSSNRFRHQRPQQRRDADAKGGNARSARLGHKIRAQRKAADEVKGNAKRHYPFKKAKNSAQQVIQTVDERQMRDNGKTFINNIKNKTNQTIDN